MFNRGCHVGSTIGALVNNAIPFFGGLYCWLLGSRKVGKPPGQDLKLDAWHARFGKVLLLIGPLLMLFAVFVFFMDFFSPALKASYAGSAFRAA